VQTAAGATGHLLAASLIIFTLRPGSSIDMHARTCPLAALRDACRPARSPEPGRIGCACMVAGGLARRLGGYLLSGVWSVGLEFPCSVGLISRPCVMLDSDSMLRLYFPVVPFIVIVLNISRFCGEVWDNEVRASCGRAVPPPFIKECTLSFLRKLSFLH
jgi:hypothetical protein